MATNSSINAPYVVLSGVSLVAIVVVFTVLRPLLAEIGDRRDKIVEQTVLLQDREEFLRTVDRKIASLQVQQEEEARLAVMLPEKERIEDALRIFHQTAQVSGLTIDTVINNSSSVQSQVNSRRARGESVAIPTNVIPLGVGLTINGTYQQLRAFITELEKTPRLMDIISITINRNETAPDQISGEMLLQFYMQSDKIDL